MTVPKVDFFNKTDADADIHDYNVGWVENYGHFLVLNAVDEVCPSGAGGDNEIACHWETDTFSNDQYAQIELRTAPLDGAIGVAVRVASGTTRTYYGFYADNNQHYLFKYASGWTQIGSTDPTDGEQFEVIKLSVSGTTLTPKINGSVWAQGSQTDETYSSGYPGICAYEAIAENKIDYFRAGNIGSLPATDSFTTTTDAYIDDYSSNWSKLGTQDILWVHADTDDIYPNGGAGANSYCVWNAAEFNDDQYSQLKVISVGTGNEIGPTVRSFETTDPNSRGCYFFIWANNATLVWKIVNDSGTQLGSSGGSASVNDIVRLEARGAVIRPMINGSTSSIGKQTDTSLSFGSAGLQGCDNSGPDARGDDWEGGNLAVPHFAVLRRKWESSSPPNIPFTINKDSNQARGLVGWYPTNNNFQDGKTLLDFSGFRRHATSTNDGTWKIVPALSEFGRALKGSSASGNGGYFIVSGFPVYPQASFTAWVYHKPTVDWTFQGLYCFTGDNRGIAIYTGSPYSDPAQTALHVGGTSYSLPSNFNGRWHHIAYVWKTGTWADWSIGTRLYLDGVLLQDNSAAVPCSGNLGIGYSEGDGFSSGGMGADFRVYNHGLSAGELANLYNPDTRWELYQPVLPRKVFYFPTVTGIDENVSLGKILRVTQPTGQNINESVDLDKFVGTTEDSQCEVEDVSILDKYVEETSNDLINIIDSTLLDKFIYLISEGIPNAIEESAILSKYNGLNSFDLVNIIDLINLLKSLNIAVSEETIVSDLVSLTKNLGLSAEGTSGVTDESVGLAKYNGLSSSDLVNVIDLVNLLKSLNIAISDEVVVNDLANLLKVLNIAISEETIVSDLASLLKSLNIAISEETIVSDLISFSKYIGLSAEGIKEGAAVEESVSLSKYLSITKTLVQHIDESVILVSNFTMLESSQGNLIDAVPLVAAFGISDISELNAIDTIILSRNAAQSNGDQTDIIDLISLLKSKDILLNSETIENDLVGLSRFDDISIVEETQGNYSEGVTLIRYNGLTVLQEGISHVNESVTVDRFGGINILEQSTFINSVIFNRSHGISITNQCLINNNVIFNRINQISLSTQGIVNSDISLAYFLELLVMEEAKGIAYESLNLARLNVLNNSTQLAAQNIISLFGSYGLSVIAGRYLTEGIDLGYSNAISVNNVLSIFEETELRRKDFIIGVALIMAFNNVNFGKSVFIVAEPPPLYFYDNGDHAASVLFRDKRTKVLFRDKRIYVPWRDKRKNK